MKIAPDAVPAELPHDGEAMLFGICLDCRADVTQAPARAHLHDAEPHAFVGDLDQAACLDARLADAKHAAGVAVEALLYDRHVDVQDIPALQHAVTGNAVADLMVYRSADRLGVGLVAGRRVIQRRGNGILHLDHVFMAQRIEFARRHPGAHVRRDEIQHFGRQTSGHPHLCDLFGCLARDGHGLGKGDEDTRIALEKQFY